MNVTEVYDPTSNTWTTISPRPQDVGSCASAAVENKIYTLGQESSAWETYIQVYNPATDNWSIKGSSPMSAFASATATSVLSAPKRIYCYYENRTDVYNPADDSWVEGTPAPTPRRLVAVVVIDDLIYVIGGRTGQ